MFYQQQELEQIAKNSAGYEYIMQLYSKQLIQLDQLYKCAYYTNYYTMMVNAIAEKQIPEQYALQLEQEAKCLVTGNYDARNQDKLWLYPAIAVAESISPKASSLIDIVRQGIMIKEKDSNVLYYIGGCSKYWRSGNIIIFQGGKQFGTPDRDIAEVLGIGKIKAEQLDIYFNSITDDLMEICIIPLLVPKGFNWINPTYYSLPNANYQESINQIVLKSAIAQLLTYQPNINELTLDGNSKNLYYINNGRYYVNPLEIMGLYGLSNFFPYPYPAYYTAGVEYAGNYDPSIFLGKIYVLAGEANTSPFYSENEVLYCKAFDFLKAPVFVINKVSIGSPVFTCTWVGGTSCSNYGVFGLVSGFINYWVKIGNNVVSKGQDSILDSIPDDFEIGLYILPVIKLPTDLTRQGMLNFASGLKQEKAVEIGLESISRAEKAISELISAGILSGIAFSAVAAVDEWDNVNQIIQDAKPYVEKLNKVYNEVLSQVNSCIEALKAPRYIKTTYELQAQQYLNGLMNYIDANACEDHLTRVLLFDMSSYLKCKFDEDEDDI